MEKPFVEITSVIKDSVRLQKISGPLVRNRHKDELKKEIPCLKSIKDWIKADLETWDKAIKKEDDGKYLIKVSEEAKHSYSKHIKNKDKS